MKFLLFLLILIPFNSLFPQCNDSIVINRHSESNASMNTSLQSITYSTYHLDSGSVTVVSATFSNGLWTSPSTITSTYNRVDSIINGAQLTELLTMEGTGNGWNPKNSIRYEYNSFGSRTSETHLQWNISAWDSVSLEVWNFDASNNLILNETFNYSLGISIKIKRTEIIFSNSHEDTIIYYKGDTLNLWSKKEMYVFNYSGQLRTSAEIYIVDSTGSWISSGIKNYFLNSYNKWVIEIQQLTPVVISSTNLTDTLTIHLDTNERTVYSRTWHYGTLSEAGMSDLVYDVMNTSFVITQYHWSQMVNWFSPPNWDVLDRTYKEIYTYDSIPRLIHIHESGACTNPCSAEINYAYDVYGRMINYIDDWESMVNNIYRSDNWEYIDSSAIKIIIPSWENDVSICPHDSIQPFIMIAGGCSMIHYQWFPSSGLSSDTILNPVISVGDTTTYTIVAYDNFGLSDTAYLTIIPRLPDLHISIDSLYCDGTAQLSMNFWQATYNWFLNDFSTQVNNNRQMYAITPGNYFCFGTYTAGEQNQFTCTFASDTVTLSVPSAVIAITNDTIFSVSQGVSFDWYSDSILTMTITDSFITVSQTGNYFAMITDSNGCVRSSNSIYYSINSIADLTLNNISVVFENSMVRILNSSGRNFNVSFFDAVGRLFINENSNDQIHMIDMNIFNRGIYFVVVEQKGKLIVRKVVMD